MFLKFFKDRGSLLKRGLDRGYCGYQESSFANGSFTAA